MNAHADSAAPGSSAFGSWTTVEGQPAFAYTADPFHPDARTWDRVVDEPTTLHWATMGNRRWRLVAFNDGSVCVWDEGWCLRWVIAPGPAGTGTSALLREGAATPTGWEAYDEPPVRTFGPTWFRVSGQSQGVAVERTILCPEGDVPWLLIRVRLTAAAEVALTHREQWGLRPRWLATPDVPDAGEQSPTVGYRTRTTATGVTAQELGALVGPDYSLVLEAVDSTPAAGQVDDAVQPVLALDTPVRLEAGQPVTLWFRFGLDEPGIRRPGAGDFADSFESLSARLPAAHADQAPHAEHEIPWHAAQLTGGACRDLVLDGHSISQGSWYSFVAGFNGAARDQLQHALPLVYTEPDLALSVMRNSCAWGSPDGDLPYGLTAARQPMPTDLRPSDQNLWFLWLAAEYAAATGDLNAFREPVHYHPSGAGGTVALDEHLRRQFRFFADVIGRGERGHVRMLHADWNDVALDDVPPDLMHTQGESVLNSAMAAWVLPVYAGLCRRLGDATQADEATALSDELREAVRASWNGRWFQRAYAPGFPPLGDDECWLEVQPWAILCGAADEDQARKLLDFIDAHHRADSPVGARVLWPLRDETRPLRFGGADLPIGQITNGGTWFAVNMTLVWAAATVDPELAWDEWRRMSLSVHTSAYPGIWEGTISGPDSYNSPESDRPGATWAVPALGMGMQQFPVANQHSHAQPLLAYLRLLGVQPDTDGSLRVGGGADFASRTLTVRADGSGRIHGAGPLTVRTPCGEVTGPAGELTWT